MIECQGMLEITQSPALNPKTARGYRWNTAAPIQIRDEDIIVTGRECAVF